MLVGNEARCRSGVSDQHTRPTGYELIRFYTRGVRDNLLSITPPGFIGRRYMFMVAGTHAKAK